MKGLILIVVVVEWPCGLPFWLLETSAPGLCELGGPGSEEELGDYQLCSVTEGADLDLHKTGVAVVYIDAADLY